MFPRTRDFVLFLSAIAFLVIGITSTVSTDLQKVGDIPFLNFSSHDEEYGVVVIDSDNNDRQKQLALMRDKVSQTEINNNLAAVISAPEAKNMEENKNGEESTKVETVTGEIKTCSAYSSFTGSWSPQGLSFEVVEGARLIYRESQNSVVAGAEPITDSELVLQLPLRTVPFGAKNCLNSDVIGIALDGSLIRNSDYTAYKIFDNQTIVGYALDGFPIYGLNKTVKTDQCGGAVESGQYAYYLSSEREGMLGCFSGLPVSL